MAHNATNAGSVYAHMLVNGGSMPCIGAMVKFGYHLGCGNVPSHVRADKIPDMVGGNKHIVRDCNRGRLYLRWLIDHVTRPCSHSAREEEMTGGQTEVDGGKRVRADVGLYGTCGSSTWRTNDVVPVLQGVEKADGGGAITVFNPHMEQCQTSRLGIEAFHMDNDRFLISVISEETSGIASMIEASYIIGRKMGGEARSRGGVEDVAFVIRDLPPPAKDGDASFVTCINMERVYLRSLAAKAGYNVFQTPADAALYIRSKFE